MSFVLYAGSDVTSKFNELLSLHTSVTGSVTERSSLLKNVNLEAVKYEKAIAASNEMLAKVKRVLGKLDEENRSKKLRTEEYQREIHVNLYYY